MVLHSLMKIVEFNIMKYNPSAICQLVKYALVIKVIHFPYLAEVLLELCHTLHDNQQLCSCVYFSTKTPFSKGELTSILKFGAEELFKDDNEDEEPQVWKTFDTVKASIQASSLSCSFVICEFTISQHQMKIV